MKTRLTYSFFSVLLSLVPSVWGYTNLTPAEVHTRLVKGDTLLLLDVREVSEYRAGHIAEPAGRLPLTPVNMPWNSQALAAEYHRLPKNVDMIIYCWGGGRSAAACAFLESKGFNRIYNMTGGFSSWTFERRENGFGEHSGRWIHSTDTSPVEIICTATGDTSKILFSPEALPAADSIYIELHFASSPVPTPPNVPQSNLEGLFRLTALDRFGLSLFIGDSLTLSDTVHISLFPKYQGGVPMLPETQNMTVYVPGEGWREVSFYFDAFSFHRNEMILRRWYNVEGFMPTGIATRSHSKPLEKIQVYPNPFNGSVQIVAPPQASISIYNIRGRLIEYLKAPTWSPDNSLVSGLYFIRVQYAGEAVTKRVVYLK